MKQGGACITFNVLLDKLGKVRSVKQVCCVNNILGLARCKSIHQRLEKYGFHRRCLIKIIQWAVVPEESVMVAFSCRFLHFSRNVR